MKQPGPNKADKKAIMEIPVPEQEVPEGYVELANEYNLTVPQFLFCEEYLETLDIGASAKKYGLKSNNIWQRYPQTRKYILSRLLDKVMSADETLWRVSQIARGDLGAFSEVKSMEDLADHPLSFLVKRFTEKTDRFGQITVSIELYSAADALSLLMKHFNLIGPDAVNLIQNNVTLKVLKGDISMDDL